MKKAVFIDCDGILNELYPKSPRGIPQSVDQFKLMPGIMPLLKKLRKAGLLREATITHSELNLSASFVVSTRWQDAEAARTIGCDCIQIKSVRNGKKPRGKT